MAKVRLIEFIKGIIIGIGNIMPGFSGGVMAVSFNVYDRIIKAITGIFKKPVEVIKDVWAIVLGAVVGIVFSLVVIKLLLDNFPVPTIMLFSGLIVGSIPTIYDKVKSISYHYLQIIAFIIGALVIIMLPILVGDKTTIIYQEMGLKTYLLMFLLGLVAATTMIVPGVSGSLILMAFGYYHYIVNFINDFMKAVLNFDFEGILANLGLVISIGLGILIGIVVLAKVMEKLLDKYPRLIYSLILGIVVASPFAIIYQMYTDYKDIIAAGLILNIIMGIVFLVIGVFLASFMTRYEKLHPAVQNDEIE